MSTGRGGLISRGGPPATRGRDAKGIVYTADYHAKVQEKARVAAEQEAARVAAEAEAARVAAEAEAARVAAVRADVLAHMAKMEEINKKMGKVPPPPVVHAPNGYAISPRVANFPPDYNYYAQPAERPVIELSPEALAYEKGERELANQLESDARLDSLRRGMGGGRKKKSKRQKKQHRRRNRRRSTRKYRK